MYSRLVISSNDLDYNIQCLKETITVPIIAVVKMDGYGITVKHAVDAWYRNGIRFFAVSEPSEAFDVLSLGYTDIDILLMSPVFDRDLLAKLISENVILTVTSLDGAMLAADVGNECSLLPRVHIKIDTGMGRFGLYTRDLKELADIYNVKDLSFEGIFSHFAAPSKKESDCTMKQFNAFLSVLSYLKSAGIEYGLSHIANSCAAIRFKDTWLDAVRIGSALLGRMDYCKDLHLKSIGVVEADVVDIKQLKKGDTSGYSMIYTAKKDTKAAVIALGHQQGFGVVYQNDSFRIKEIIRNLYYSFRDYRKPVFVKFKESRVPIIGRVGNQYSLFDITNIDIKIGDTVTTNINILLVGPAVERVLQ